MILFFLVAFLASVVGAICGSGGGVIIKPVLDLLHMETVSAIQFLSGCTVLSMSAFSVIRSRIAGERHLDGRTGAPLIAGAVIGGLAGNQLFSLVKSAAARPETVSAIQAVCLALITLGTLLYTVKKARIHALQVRSPVLSALIGLALGLMSSFLGIGGGPINLVMLFYFFSMDTKTAAASSLSIIFFSQLASLLVTLLTGAVPVFQWPALALMIAGGIGGGIAGRSLNKRMDGAAVDKLFICLMAVIICICLYNIRQYTA